MVLLCDNDGGDGSEAVAGRRTILSGLQSVVKVKEEEVSEEDEGAAVADAVDYTRER